MNDTKKILFTVVGQIREYSSAIFSHIQFIEQLKSAIGFTPGNPTADKIDIYISVVTWDSSYSIFPRGVESFCQKISEEYVHSIINTMFDIHAKSVRVTIVQESDARRALQDAGIAGAVEEFQYVAYLHDCALQTMLQIEQEENFKFDMILLSRPDLYIEFKTSTVELLRTLSPSAVYYKKALTTTSHHSMTNSDEITYYEEYVDQFNIFGRAAFYAYGLMFKYMAACNKNPDSAVFMYNPSLHFWVDRYLEKFRITKSELSYLDVGHCIIRPIHKSIAADINFSEGKPESVLIELAKIEAMWQHDINNPPAKEAWIQRFKDANVVYRVRP